MFQSRVLAARCKVPLCVCVCVNDDVGMECGIDREGGKLSGIVEGKRVYEWREQLIAEVFRVNLKREAANLTFL